MLDPGFLRNNLEALAERLRLRGYDIPLDVFAQLDAERRHLIVESERLKHERNESSEQIGKLMREKKDAEPQKAKVRNLGNQIKEYEERLKQTDLSFRLLMSEIPNVPHESVPVGKDESANRVERVVGEPASFSFPPKPHWEVGERLGILDFERAAKIAGARCAVMKGAGALAAGALIAFMLGLH